MPTKNFRKVRPGAGAQYYAAEASGLRWLEVPGGPPIPKIVSVGSAALELERINESAPTVASAVNFGKALSVMHRSGADSFGASPPDAPTTGWIADVPMPFGEFATFGSMYAELRIRPYLKLCREADAFTAGDFAVFDELCEQLMGGSASLVGPPEEPARLHGDLWSGNLLWAPDREGVAAVWLIDPAAYGGHRETDLAMLMLFGVAQLDRIIASYDDAFPLAPGWRERVSLHQVYPLLVHTVLFGGGYAGQAVAAARRALTLVG